VSHILLISYDATIPDNLREALAAPELRIVNKNSPEAARSILSRGAIDLAIIYSNSGDAKLVNDLKALSELSPETPVMVISESYSLDEEQRSFELGADLYFSEPLPTQSLQRIISRHSLSSTQVANVITQPATTQNIKERSRSSSALHILRDFSNILGFSLDYRAFTQHFALKLREHISFSRMGIFLESSAKQTIIKDRDPHHLTCIASLGLPADLIDCFQLSREVGIGKTIQQQPHILTLQDCHQSHFEGQSNAIQKEFKVLGCDLAVPITDRERTIGVAVLNGPVTGRGYTEDELQLLYLLMEELGLAIRNSRLHAEIGRHGTLIENVLSSMTSGAIVINEDLDILYANRAAKRFLQIEPQESRSIEFAELPSELAAPIHRAVEKGELPRPFQLSSPAGNKIYQASIFPFKNNEELELLPRPTMVVLEDFTHIEANKQKALEDSKSELIGLIAERFAHEIRNALVPITTHLQLIDKKIDQPVFQASLKTALKNETDRIQRFSEQMLYLAQNSNPAEQTADLGSILNAAFEAAKKTTANTTAHLQLGDLPRPSDLKGDIEGMTYAFEEIFLNAIQASEASAAKIQVRVVRTEENSLNITMRDSGPGFSNESIEQATEPFYTSRPTGVGLGLSVAKKIIETHHGFVQLNQRTEINDWDLLIQLPTTLAPTPL